MEFICALGIKYEGIIFIPFINRQRLLCNLCYWLNDRGSIPGTSTDFIFATVSRAPLGPTQPHIQWILGVKRRGR